MADMHVKVLGTWKRVVRPHVRVSGSWKGVNNAYVRVSGVWKRFFAWGVVTLSGETIVDSDQGSALVRFNTDGTVDKVLTGVSEQIDSGTDWIIPNGAAQSLYEFKWDQVSGDPMNSGNMSVEGTWYALSTNRSVGLSVGVPIADSGVITVSVRYNGGAVIDTANYDITAIDTS